MVRERTTPRPPWVPFGLQVMVPRARGFWKISSFHERTTDKEISRCHT